MGDRTIGETSQIGDPHNWCSNHPKRATRKHTRTQFAVYRKPLPPPLGGPPLPIRKENKPSEGLYYTPGIHPWEMTQNDVK